MKKFSLKQEFRGKTSSTIFSDEFIIVGEGKTEVVESTDPLMKGEQWEFYITDDKKHFPKEFIDEHYIQVIAEVEKL